MEFTFYDKLLGFVFSIPLLIYLFYSIVSTEKLLNAIKKSDKEVYKQITGKYFFNIDIIPYYFKLKWRGFDEFIDSDELIELSYTTKYVSSLKRIRWWGYLVTIVWFLGFILIILQIV